MKIATISSKGQITLPRSLMQELDITTKSKVLIERSNGTLVIQPIRKSIVEQTAGSLAKYIPKEKRGVPFNKIREITQRLAAEELMKKYSHDY